MKRKRSSQKDKEITKKKSMNLPVVINLETSPGSPLRSVLCVKSNMNLKEIEEREDCFILDFDRCGDDAVFSVDKGFDDDADLSVIGEKGKVACRDYPHSRHLCAKNHFEKTPHQSYCELCYCFVCDVAAPCNSWTGKSGHCHAIDNESWKSMRKTMRKGR